MRLRFLGFVLIFACLSSCKTQQPRGDDGKLNITFIQVNDVYEIAPLEAGKSGGMARIAALKKQALQQNPNSFLVMAGDFVSPSIYNSLTYEGKRVRGRQMIDAMNVAGFDFACFGNHEFDITEKELQDRINESTFSWISANAFHKVNGTPVPFRNQQTNVSFPSYIIRQLRDADGTVARVGFISVVLPSNPAEYVQYTDPIRTAVDVYEKIKDSCDAVVALTHLALADDKRLAAAAPGLALIMGGHEHDMKFDRENGIYITKAHANAKSAYVINLQINTRKKKSKASPQLRYLDATVPLDSTTNVTVQKWVKIAADNFASSGFDAAAVIPYEGEPLIGNETPTRNASTNLTRLIAASMLFAAPEADAAVYNSGSIRLDDVLYPPITQYDILRTLPFGGGLRVVQMKGSLLQQLLNQGVANKGSGGWLQYANISQSEFARTWQIKGQLLNAEGVYTVVIPDFLLTGKEANMGFFTEKNPGVLKVYPAQTAVGHPQSDIRQAIIQYLSAKK